MFPKFTASHANAFTQPRDGLAKIQQLPRNRALEIPGHVLLVKLLKIVHHR